jgi:outer membrane lipoprotein-sorting protein
MRWLSALILVFIFPLLVFAQNEAQLLKQVKAKMNKVNDYQAKGSMIVDVPFINAPGSDVTVYYKKPDRFKVVKAGGISILPKGGVSVNINSILLNEKYEVVPAKDAVVDGVKTKVVRLLPEEGSTGDIVLTTLYIDEKDLVIRKANVTTKDNGTYEVNMSYGKFVAWGLPDKVTFTFNTKDFKLPKGVTFDYEKGDQKKVQSAKDQKGKVVINYSTYTINKGIDDKVF